MILEELKPKYSKLEIYFDKENFSILEIPQIMQYDFALTMYADRKVVFSEEHDDRKVTEVLLENDQQHRKRKNFSI